MMHVSECLASVSAWIRVRYMVVFMATVASLVTYMSRTTLNIAIVKMVIDDGSDDGDNDSVNATRIYCSAVQDISGNSTIGITDDDIDTGPRYDWNQAMQGQILGSVYYTYIAFQVPGGIIAEVYGAKWVIIASLLGSGILSLLTPILTSLHVGALLFIRLALGAFQAGFFPAAFGLMCHWTPVRERSTAFALLYAGCAVGSAVPSFISGQLINTYGWPSMFYMPGIISVVFTIVFIPCVTSKPEQCSFMSKEEIRDIRGGESCDAGKDEKIVIPWKGILLNPSVLSTAIFQFFDFWVIIVLTVSLPTYLAQIIRMDISSNGTINGLVQLIPLVPTVFMGGLTEVVIQKKWASRTVVRKVVSLLDGTACGICVLLIPLAGCNTAIMIAVLLVGSMLTGCTVGADTPIVSEMTEKYPAAVYSFLNMVATASGFVAPAVVGAILQSVEDQWIAWSIVFYLSGGLVIAANILFILFAEAKRQKFDYL